MAALQIVQNYVSLTSLGERKNCLSGAGLIYSRRRNFSGLLQTQSQGFSKRNRPLKTTAEGGLRETVTEQAVGADEVVDQLLALVEDTDRGASLDKEQRELVSELVSRLEGMDIPPEPLQSPLIFGDWDVAYCSNPTAPGGYYRSAIGRLLLTTEEMVQTVNPPDFVGNQVSFAVLGMLKGIVSLRGKLTPLDRKWIEITFEPPFLKLGPFEFRYGKNSTVKIAVLYVDGRIRLGRGSRGSVFVFRRRNYALTTSTSQMT